MITPKPVFTIQPVAYTTHFVNPSSPMATDVNNPQGTLLKPRKTIPSVLPKGSVVEVRGTLAVGGSSLTITAQGTDTLPVVIKGVGAPLFQGAYGGKITFAGSWLRVEGCVFDNVALIVTAVAVEIAGNEIRGHSPAGNSAAVSAVTTYQVFQGNHIHHNGDSESLKEIDVHGIKVVTGSSQVWILDNHIHHNGGDAVQVGEAQAAEPWARYVYIEGNTCHEDRENAFDVKKSRDVLIARNVVYGYKERNSSSGEGIVVHDGAERVWILQNTIIACVRGIVSTGSKGFLVLGNLLLLIKHNTLNTYDPASGYGSHAITVRDSANIHLLDNTVWDSDGGISLPAGNSGVIRVGNHALNVGNHTVYGTTTEAGANVPFTVFDVRDAASGDFRPVSGGALVGVSGMLSSSEVLAAYQSLYGVAITTDLYKGPFPPAAVGAADVA